MDDPVDAVHRLFKASVISQIGQGEIGIEMADFAIITRIADHQPRFIPINRKLAGNLIADKAGGTGYQKFHFFSVGSHFSPSTVARSSDSIHRTADR